MTHEEYLERLESFGDSPADVAAVLNHASACTRCRIDERAAESALARLDARRASRVEILARWSVAAAILTIVALGFQKEARRPDGAFSTGMPARYVVVGNASGVVAHTPEGIVVGVAPRSSTARKEIVK